MRFRLSALGVFASFGLVFACGGAQKRQPPPPAAQVTVSPPSAPAARSADAPVAAATYRDEPVATLTPIDRPQHEQSRALVREGKLHQAKRILGRLAAAYPEERKLLEQYNGITARIEERQTAARVALQAKRLAVPPAPAFAKTASRAKTGTAGPIPKLAKASEKRNEITDDEKWFTENGPLPEYFIPPANDYLFAPGILSATVVGRSLDGFRFTDYEVSRHFLTDPLPVEVPLAYGTVPLTRAIASPPYLIAIYGANIVAVFDEKFSPAGLFDLSSYVHPAANQQRSVVVGSATLTTSEGTQSGNVVQTVDSITLPMTFALARDGVLYVTHSNLEYASANKGQNAYVAALELETGEPLWRSAPLVANIRNFVIVGGGIVCGYGFTAEPDFVYVLDRATGDVKQKLPLRSGPDFVVAKGNRLFIRTYDTNYAFDVRP